VVVFVAKMDFFFFKRRQLPFGAVKARPEIVRFRPKVPLVTEKDEGGRRSLALFRKKP
jgi:hypothetical protein